MDDQSLSYFVSKFSKIYPVSHALWRAFEANRLRECQFIGPILDLGCGDGSFASILLPKTEYPNLSIVGVDIDKNDCTKAEKNNFYDKVICAPSHNIPAASDSFKMVYSNSVLEHVVRLDDTLKEVNRILERGGKLLFSIQTKAFSDNLFYTKNLKKIGLGFIGKAYANSINAIFRHLNCLNSVEWEQTLGRNGFGVVDIKHTLAPKSEKFWDIFLPLSYLQHIYTKKLNKNIPFWGLNKKFVSKLVKKCTPSEASLKNDGGNVIVLAQKN